MNFIEKLAEYSWKMVLLIGGALCAFYYFTSYDNGEQIESFMAGATANVKQQRELLAETEKALADAKRFEQDVRLITAQFNELLKFLPETTSGTDLHEILSKEAVAAGVSVNRIMPKGKGEKKEFLETFSVELELQGTYSQIVLFLSYLSKIKRLLTIEKAEMVGESSNPESARIKFAATIIAYRYVPEKAPAPGQANEAGQVPNAAAN